MKVKLDETMPAAIRTLLREAGHDTRSVAEEGLAGTDDDGLIEAATSEGRVLITFDVGFGNIRAFPPGSHAGIVVFRLHDQQWVAMEEPARRMLASGTLEPLERRLAVIDESRIRVGARTREES